MDSKHIKESDIETCFEVRGEEVEVLARDMRRFTNFGLDCDFSPQRRSHKASVVKPPRLLVLTCPQPGRAAPSWAAPKH